MGVRMNGSREKKIFRKLSFSFLLATSSWSMLNTLQVSYWQYFMTDVCLMDSSVAGTVLLIAGIIDFITCLFVGYIVEKLNFSLGKYRTWMLICPPFFVLGFFMMFTDYGLGESVMAAIMTLGYTIAYLAANIAVTVKNLVPSTEATTEKERAILSAKKGQGSAIGPFLFGIIALNIIMYFNGGSQNGAFGYTIATLVLVSIAVICHFILFFSMANRTSRRMDAEEKTRSSNDESPSPSFLIHPAPEQNGEKIPKIQIEHIPLRKLAKAILASRSYVALLVADAFRYVGRAVLVGMAAYYFGYVLRDPASATLFFSASGIVAIIGAVIAEIMVTKVSKSAVYVTGYLMMIACFFIMFAFGTSAFAFNAIACLWFFGLALVNGTHLGLYADAIDLGIDKAGIDYRAWLMSLSTLCPKVGTIMRALITGYGLMLIGYTAGMDPTYATVMGMRVITCIIPALLMLAGLVVYLAFYRVPSSKK